MIFKMGAFQWVPASAGMTKTTIGMANKLKLPWEWQQTKIQVIPAKAGIHCNG